MTTEALGLTDTGNWTSAITPTGTTPSWNIANGDLQAGANVITYEVDNAGCDPVIATETITIEAITQVNVNLNVVPTLCEGVSANYTANGTGGGTPSYVWSYSEDTSVGGSTGSNTLSLSNVQESVGTVTVVMTSSVRCVDSRTATANSTLTVVPGPLPEVITADTTICVDSPIILTGQDNSTFAQPTTYQWYRDGTIAVGDGSFTLTDVKVSGTYTLQASNGICAAVNSVGKVVTVRQVPDVNASANGINPIVGDFDDNIQLEGSSDLGTVVWTINTTDVTITNTTDVSTPATAIDGGRFVATLTATNGPCESSDVVALVLTIPISAPNVFTPNGDGYFETFTIKGVETYPGAIVTIFNRWGKPVYESDNYKSHEWDASNVPDGVYYFVVRTGLEGYKNHSGVIHVIR